ncbi:alpha/beta hydrolase [Salinibacterium sp. SYSU T00001]|uniref:alpha/beta fold hydrolase n=1 Tax=Homoserinimonas sedimenticola TaxID=2986805 RepID=UPI00223560E5|nr:alpha/beta hydrolase [Salinibacterium sedimenticola]MCW4384640.1 alpha/beta hydrolase [Salinibacterium sedimenticola]
MPTHSPAWFDPAVYDTADVHQLAVGRAHITYRTGGSGDGPRLLFVHGGRAHATWWAPQLALFGPEPPKWAAIDLSGHGDSDWRDEYRAQLWLDEVRAVAAHLAEADRLVLVGHSLGGMLSVLLAVSGSVEGIERVITVDAVPLDPGMGLAQAEPSTSKPFYPSLDEGVSAFAQRPAREAWPTWLARFVGERSLRPHDGGWVWRHDNASRVIERPTIDDFGALDLTRLTLITGKRSPYRASILASGFVERAGTALRRIDLDTGHDVMMERPEEFHRVLEKELEH